MVGCDAQGGQAAVRSSGPVTCRQPDRPSRQHTPKCFCTRSHRGLVSFGFLLTPVLIPLIRLIPHRFLIPVLIMVISARNVYIRSEQFITSITSTLYAMFTTDRLIIRLFGILHLRVL